MYLVPKIRGGCVKTDTPSFSYAKFPSENAPNSQVKMRQIPKYVLFSIAIWSKITKHSE